MKLSFEDVKNNASAPTMEKAQAYVNKFMKWTCQENILRGNIKGSEGKIYQVEVCCSDPAYLKAHCTCPAQMDFCKHSAALCITYILSTKKTEEPTISFEKAILEMDENILKEKIISLMPEFPGLGEKLASGILLKTINEKTTIGEKSLQDMDEQDDWESVEF